MRLGVNALRLSGQKLGVGRYIEYMVKYWGKHLGRSDRVTLYVRERSDADGLQLTDAFEVKALGPKIKGVLWEQLLLPRCRKETDVLFCPSYTMPLSYRGRCVVATHSVNEIQDGAHSLWYRYTYSARYRLSALKADRVIVPSHSTKEHVADFYGVSPDRIDVVPEGAPDFFQPVEDETLLRATRRRFFGDERPYILFVGKQSQRRNIPALLKAFSLLKQSEKIPHGLLLFGPNVLGLPLEQMASELGIEDSLVQTDGKLGDHREILPVYCAADLFVHPSSYEGFSITLVEAMASGVPVVTVNRGAAREIAEECALMVDDPSAENLRDAMGRALSDRPLMQSLRAKAIDRARCFRYEETARRTLEILRRVAEGGEASVPTRTALQPKVRTQ